ncbi:GNAT family N-acetyltransferase [Noviherbaspirillum sp. CPCC 100848]|uniref:GNAT family N-acetyltransferase n=1 Tax=Noviherbaspirillum album TaxID=3080276 RepID=A0ABU6JAN4_9BURK|nr:GNAT family N-acetyltransferase [Noviherbaspirillum sp. CPCC 100848]MEC4720709.1 GNAT family N-acetyltransferase [Noviherbaspirillum sp. CPCC 100848]
MKSFAIPTTSTLPGNDYEFRMLCEKEMGQLLDFRNLVLSSLSNADHYVKEQDEAVFVHKHLGPEGFTIGVYSNDELVAYAMLGLPPADETNELADRVDIPVGHRHLIAHVAGCMVHPAHRGRQLQKLLLAKRIEGARAQGKRYCISMASLSNHASRRNLLASGFHIARVTIMEAALKRQLLLLDMVEQPVFDLSSARMAAAEDYATQQVLTQQGFRGIGEERDAATRAAPQLVFAKQRKAGP